MDPTLRMQARQHHRRAARHRRHGLAPVPTGGNRTEVRTRRRRNHLAPHIGLRPGSVQGADVHHERRVAPLANQPGDIVVFLTFGVERPENSNGGHECRRHRTEGALPETTST